MILRLMKSAVPFLNIEEEGLSALFSSVCLSIFSVCMLSEYFNGSSAVVSPSVYIVPRVFVIGLNCFCD